MPGCDGLCATRQIIAEMPEMKIVVLTTSSDDNDLFEAVKSGACGYLLKSMDADELVECLNQAEQGIPPFSPGLAAKILNEFIRIASTEDRISEEQAAAAADRQSPLTPRQLQVLDLVAQGYSYKEVGKKLSLSPRTVKYHMAEIMARLHLEHRSQVLAYAGRLGMGDEK
jgi:two-component system NarL family response regulator